MEKGTKGLYNLEDIIHSIKSNIDKLLLSREKLIIAIDGKSGSGKTTLAAKLGDLYDSNVFHMDDFFLPAQLRTEERLKEVGGNVDYFRFKKEVINKLLMGNNFSYRIFDCRIMGFREEKEVGPKKLNIVEGSYSMHPSLVDSYDLKIFLDLDDDLQRKRILERNGPMMLEKFVGEWIPKENIYFNQMKIRENSDLYFTIDI